MSRIRDDWARLVAALTLTGVAVAQHASVPEPLRFGVFFWHDSPNDEVAFAGIETALRDAERSYELVVRRAGEDRELGGRQLDEMRAAGVDLVFALGTEAALLAGERIRDLPIVFTAVTNPVESGIVDSWRGSGRNIAGNSNWIAPETVMHVFRMTVPALTRLGVLRSESGVVSAAELRGMRGYLAGPDAPKVELVERIVAGDDTLESVVEQLAAARVDAIWIPIDIRIYENTAAIFRAAQAHGIPLVSSSLKGTRSGAAAGIVVDYELLGRRAAVIALDVLDRGADPGKLPVAVLHGYRVVVNLEAARRCGHELPLSVLALADVLLERVEDGEDDGKPR